MPQTPPASGKKRNLPLGQQPSQKRQRDVPAGARCLEARHEWLELLRAYKQEHRSANPSRNEWYRGFPLGEWLRDQKLFFKSLCSLGVSWQEEESDELFVPGDLLFVMPAGMHHHEQPAIHREQHHHQDFAPQNQHEINPQVLPDEEEIKKIDQYNPRANDGPGSRGPRGSDADRWNVMFALLREYRAANNSDFPKQSEHFRSKPIGRWCAKQRQLMKQGKLPEDRRCRLDSIGFLWDLGQRIQVAEGVTVGQWDYMLYLAKQYQKEHGHLNPGLKEKYRAQSIGIWVRNQRAHYKMRMEGKLSANSPQMSQKRIDLLNAIHFEWTRPRRCDEVASDKKLIDTTQRQVAVTKRVKPVDTSVFAGIENDDLVEQIKNERGGESWLANYVELKRFYTENGHSNLTRGGVENTLASWAHKQRFNWKLRQEKKISEKSTVMSDSRVALLRRLEFPFDQRVKMPVGGPSAPSTMTESQPAEKTTVQHHGSTSTEEV